MPLPVLLLSRRRRSQRGQAIVLGSLSFLVLALMVTLSFNLSHALRQKMSLQQHGDAMSFSMGVLEARALNYYAVTNRAIAGSYVAMNSLHAYMATASITGEMLRAGQENFNQIVITETARCVACRGTCPCCKHLIEAGKIAAEFGKKGRLYDRDVRGLEGNFRAAMTGLDLMVDNIHTSQRGVHEKTVQAVKDGSSHGLSQLKTDTAPNVSDLSSGVGALNANEFNCAVDGMQCQGSVANSAPEARARVMTEIGNASRSGWPANRNGSGMPPKQLHPLFLKEFMDIPGNKGTYSVLGHKGSSKTVQNRNKIYESGQSSGNQGSTVAATESGMLSQVSWEDAIPPLPADYEAFIWSASGGGGHTVSGQQHKGQHRFEGTNAKALTACAGSGNCFMKYRANPDQGRDWGQPRVYSYYTMKLNVGDPKKAPWELNNSRRVKFEHGAQGSGDLTLAAGEGMSLSKSLVYYHRFKQGGWSEPPNLFAPYWRVKLHPFTPQEAKKVLEDAGNSDAATIAEAPEVSL
ncbi:hypothetical protein FJV41_21805 [Myxococcus llanfairpwllgwyngyllgogerychwyrndrobwllllantysiliogogogochensis]|uniref:Uncharacterized protein n=1 Tax=Myxococcus llanfairpwllgwyngyllgogerychwyrndrobwllllantysiliogogogochensis TaxID=2590453 RepID=A0A540WXV7_9BACT|nr:hypothetical protein [Myxococcus llanfairpwllgwyngyllgogerychwyrndrobwllllantysiliogogogochensis]TQF13846.1 hypothetical protein FJV41_21805 [Myxococcus llanfairpwllgwyngyllgogerychwyrndrobwllllantysiliogogogochensis]